MENNTLKIEFAAKCGHGEKVQQIQKARKYDLSFFVCML